MNEMADQLKELITINRKIINQLHSNEADIDLLQKRFDERGKHADKLTTITNQTNTSSFTDEEKKKLNVFFERFDQQEQKIQSALDYILEESKERLNDAIKTSKAEESYQLLNR